MDSARGARLRAARKALGLTQDEMGARGGVHRNTQAAYEKGALPPDADYLAKLSELGVDILHLVTGEKERPRANTTMEPREATLLDHFRQLDDKRQQHLCWVAADIAELSTAARGRA